MRAATKRLAQIIRERANVRPLAALDLDFDIRRLEPKQLDAVDPGTTRSKRDGSALSGEAVRGLAADLYGAEDGWRLLNLSEKRGEGFLDLHLPNIDHARFVRRRTLGVIRVGRYPESDGGAIGLREVHQVLADARCLAYQDEQHAACERVKRSCVSNLADTSAVPYQADDAE
jgi:hypothetical protein